MILGLQPNNGWNQFWSKHYDVLPTRVERYCLILCVCICDCMSLTLYFPFDTSLVLHLLLDAYGENSFSPITEAFFNNAVLLHGHRLVQCCKNKPMVAVPTKSRLYKRLYGYISGCFAIGSSGLHWVKRRLSCSVPLHMLMEIKYADKVPFLDSPVSPTGLFGPAVEGFAERFTVAQKSSQAM